VGVVTCQGLYKIFRAPIHRAHRAVIFAIAQLSCLKMVAPTRRTRWEAIWDQFL